MPTASQYCGIALALVGTVVVICGRERGERREGKVECIVMYSATQGFLDAWNEQWNLVKMLVLLTFLLFKTTLQLITHQFEDLIKFYIITTWKKTYLVGPDNDIAIPGQRCFELISSHQQGVRTACPAHHWFIYGGRTRTLVVQWFQN